MRHPFRNFLIALAILAIPLSIWFNPQMRARVSKLASLANNEVEPIQLADRIWYVGGRDAAAFLLTGPNGHILIDGGYEDSAQMILDNIAGLGFEAGDVKILLNTHGHWDHAGGLAALKAATGARLLVNPAERSLIEAGGEGDFYFGDGLTYPRVKADGVLRDGGTISLGPIRLTPLFTPGHTKGCTSWAIPARIKGRPAPALLICGITQTGAPLKGNEAYPGIARDYTRSIARLDRQPCQILLMPHGTQMEVSRKIDRWNAGDVRAFVDPKGCKTVIAEARDALAAAQ
jgi:metallo-beta-lactamase class B